jgi:hypothetical protein
MRRLHHDIAWAASAAIVDLFQNLLRPEEVRDAMEETYRAVRAALEAYDAHRAHIARRLKPMDN